MTKLVLLYEPDRARYNLPEEVEYEPGLFGRKSVAELKAQTGYTLDSIAALLRGIPRLQPDGSEVIERDDLAAIAFAWLILWDSGHKIPWVDFDLRGGLDFSFGGGSQPDAHRPGARVARVSSSA